MRRPASPESPDWAYAAIATTTNPSPQAASMTTWRRCRTPIQKVRPSRTRRARRVMGRLASQSEVGKVLTASQYFNIVE